MCQCNMTIKMAIIYIYIHICIENAFWWSYYIDIYVNSTIRYCFVKIAMK